MNIYSLSPEKMAEYFLSINETKFRATQVYEWLYKKNVADIDLMTNIKKDVREKMKEDFEFPSFELVTKQVARDKTTKLLFKMDDGNLIETVIMPQSYGYSVCVTSQVGCNIGCTFCASGQLKKIRDLNAGEMIMQIIYANQELEKYDKKISHIVVMGIGEPFDNYDNVIDFIKIVNYKKGLEIGARHITVSTSGLVPGIQKFALEPFQVNLAISLHAANDRTRSKLMKINDVYNLDDVMKAVDEYILHTNRRVTFEYILIDSVNDSLKDVDELATLVHGRNVYINIIPYNSVLGNEYKRPSKESIDRFYDALKKRRSNVTLRREMGNDIDAACGQLRAKEGEK